MLTVRGAFEGLQISALPLRAEATLAARQTARQAAREAAEAAAAAAADSCATCGGDYAAEVSANRRPISAVPPQEHCPPVRPGNLVPCM